MFYRAFEIEQNLEIGKVLIIYGPRQVGKTTLVKSYLAKTSLKSTYYTGDDLSFAQDLAKCDLNLIRGMVGKRELIVIDEAQKIENIGRALKLIVDNISNIRVVVTGSSSFDLAQATDEPLTGRKNVITLFPISILELSQELTEYELRGRLEEHIIYGMYPNVLTYQGYRKKQKRISEIADSYLIKDILEFHRIHRSQTIINLLKLLAFQIGSEVSTTELGKKLGIDGKTVAYYLDLLQKAFVIYQVGGFSRNLRKEVTKMSKYYFYDTGIRNALISNFNGRWDRDDWGRLWENFVIMERLKRNAYLDQSYAYYFWRTYTRQEIDWIEEGGGQLDAYEIKWQSRNIKPPSDWATNYPQSEFKLITPDDLMTFLT